MVTVNEYRRDLAGRIREARRAMDKRRKEIETEQGLDKAFARWKIMFEEAKTRLTNVLQQRKDSIMWDVNLSSDAKQSIISVYEQEYSIKIEEQKSVFDKTCQDIDRQVEEDETFKHIREKLEEILSERNSEVYKKAEQAHIDERNKFLELKRIEKQVTLERGDLAVAEFIFKQKQGNRVLNEQSLERIDAKRQSLKERIEDLKRQLDYANSMLPDLNRRREAIFNNLESSKREEKSAKKDLEKEEYKWMDVLEAREKAKNKLIERQIANEGLDIDIWTTANKSMGWSDEIQSFTWWIWNKELLKDDNKNLLEEIEKISSMRWPKIWKYVWIYERLWYIISDRSALVSQLTEARKSHPSLLWEIKNDLIKRIQDPENNKPQKKIWRGGIFFFIDFSCWGIILSDDMKTILCAAPQLACKNILTWEITNFSQVFNRKE